MRPAVRIRERDYRPARLCDAKISRCIGAGRAAYQPSYESRLPSRWRNVLGAIVHEQHFEGVMVEGLHLQAAQKLRHEMPLVEDRYDNRDPHGLPGIRVHRLHSWSCQKGRM